MPSGNQNSPQSSPHPSELQVLRRQKQTQAAAGAQFELFLLFPHFPLSTQKLCIIDGKALTSCLWPVADIRSYLQKLIWNSEMLQLVSHTAVCPELKAALERRGLKCAEMAPNRKLPNSPECCRNHIPHFPIWTPKTPVLTLLTPARMGSSFIGNLMPGVRSIAAHPVPIPILAPSSFPLPTFPWRLHFVFHIPFPFHLFPSVAGTFFLSNSFIASTFLPDSQPPCSASPPRFRDGDMPSSQGCTHLPSSCFRRSQELLNHFLINLFLRDKRWFCDLDIINFILPRPWPGCFHPIRVWAERLFLSEVKTNSQTSCSVK